MTDDRNRLIELLDMNCGYVEEMSAEALADYLISNGVTFSKKKLQAVYLGFSNHDCEARYICPVCRKGFGSWAVFNQPKNKNGTKKYCPHCKVELNGLD